MGYRILMDTQTKTYFMFPNEFRFHVYTEEFDLDYLPIEILSNPNHYVLQTEIDDISTLETYLFNVGFTEGFLDGRLYHIDKANILYFNPNPNYLLFAQYLLTKNHEQKNCANYLQGIDKEKLWTYGKPEGTRMTLPSVMTKRGVKVLSYTEQKYIPEIIKDKYIKDGYSLIQLGELSNHIKVVINDYEICDGYAEKQKTNDE